MFINLVFTKTSVPGMIPDVDSKTQTEGHVNNTVQSSEFKLYHIVLFE